MKYPKQLVSGKDINLSKYNLGIIRQPRVDDFMDDYDLQDFIKSFYKTFRFLTHAVHISTIY